MSYFVRINNLINYPERIDRLIVDFDDNQIQTFTRFNIPDFFDISYTKTGTKTIKVSTFPIIQNSEPVIQVFKNLVTVVDQYDVIDSTYYQEASSFTFNLPYSSAPMITPDEWVTHSTFNNCIKKIYTNFEYLVTKAKAYDSKSYEYQGWYGTASAEIGLNINNGGKVNFNLVWNNLEKDKSTAIKWEDIECNKIGTIRWENISCKTYSNILTAEATDSNTFITDMLANTQTSTDNGCVSSARWHLKLPKLNGYVDTVGNVDTDNNCIGNDECTYTDIYVEDDVLLTSTSTYIRACSTNLLSTPIEPLVIGIDKNTTFGKITAIVKDSSDRVYVCDKDLHGVACFQLNRNNYNKWSVVFSMYGLGSVNSKHRFNKPVDITIDEFSNLYVLDSNNLCIKIFTARGSWIRTVNLTDSDPLSLAIDSDKRLHILYNTKIVVYDVVANTFLNSYDIKGSETPIKIRSNYVKEIFYVVYKNKVQKYFKNGTYFSDIDLSSPKCIDNITNIHQDKNRNLYILTNDYIVKYTDLMFLDSKMYTDSYLNISNYMWSLSDIAISRDEMLQDITYTTAFHRMWDNIEILRRAVRNKNTEDNTPIYQKSDIFIGQNEIVSTGVMNRCVKYLWDNLSTLNKYLSN
jgi:hypothetical protein